MEEARCQCRGLRVVCELDSCLRSVYFTNVTEIFKRSNPFRTNVKKFSCKVFAFKYPT